jgi:hypothetical protein
MTSKKEISDRINEKLPSEGEYIDFTKLSKDDLLALEKKLDTLLEWILEGGEELASEMIVQRSKNMAKKRLGMDKNGQDALGAFVKNRLQKGLVAGVVKTALKKRLQNNDDQEE